MTESHIDTANAEERQNDTRQSDTSSATVTTGMSVHATSNTSTTLHSISHRDSAVDDQSPLQPPAPDTLPTDMSDTTESDADKHLVAGVCTSIGHHGT